MSHQLHRILVRFDWYLVTDFFDKDSVHFQDRRCHGLLQVQVCSIDFQVCSHITTATPSMNQVYPSMRPTSASMVYFTYQDSFPHTYAPHTTVQALLLPYNIQLYSYTFI